MCIGNTVLTAYYLRDVSVYPYVYREHEGSIEILSAPTRFIPMCIGNTLASSADFLAFSVYPYVYREHIKKM